MGNKAPQGVVIDQCKAMQNAIAIVFPNTRHRWCLWHIMKKLPEKLSGYNKDKEIKHGLKKLVYDSSSVMDFESGWAKYIDNYDLQLNEWLYLTYLKKGIDGFHAI